MKVLISGAGVAGPTAAYWLSHCGVETTIVEQAPRLRTGGYIIDFWGAGYEIADRMGLLPKIQRSGYMVREVRVVDDRGKRIAGFPAAVFSRVTDGRFVSLPRGDLAASIFGAIDGTVATIFGDSIAHIEQTEDTVHVCFESGMAGDFDLVIGADGLHSRVREIVFGPQRQFETYLGYKVAAFEVEGYRPRDELVYVMYTEVGQQVARFTMRNDRTMFLFIFADPIAERPGDADMPGQKASLIERFGRSGWECRKMLDALVDAKELYFDRISQIRMGTETAAWSRGRVTLVGDAASCVSLLAGQGSALAMAAAYILAAEVRRADGDLATALVAYQEHCGPLMHRKQKAALRFAGTFAPKSVVSMFLRNQIMNLLTIPWIADLVVARDLVDNLALPPL